MCFVFSEVCISTHIPGTYTCIHRRMIKCHWTLWWDTYSQAILTYVTETTSRCQSLLCTKPTGAPTAPQARWDLLNKRGVEVSLCFELFIYLFVRLFIWMFQTGKMLSGWFSFFLSHSEKLLFWKLPSAWFHLLLLLSASYLFLADTGIKLCWLLKKGGGWKSYFIFI